MGKRRLVTGGVNRCCSAAHKYTQPHGQPWRRIGDMISHAKLCLLAAALFVASCASAIPGPTSVSQIVSTTSFGMCVGYCTTRLEISEGRAVLIREARGGRGAPGDLPDQRYTAALTANEWSDLARLAATTNFNSLPSVIGCPDCADGGAESLTVNGSGASRSVSFEHGAAIAQAQPLLDRVRALRTRLTPE